MPEPTGKVPPRDLHLPCPKCGYDLHGLQGYRCPECGVLVDLEELAIDSQDPLLRIMRASFRVLAAFVGMFACSFVAAQFGSGNVPATTIWGAATCGLLFGFLRWARPLEQIGAGALAESLLLLIVNSACGTLSLSQYPSNYYLIGINSHVIGPWLAAALTGYCFRAILKRVA